jgi:protein tyrosine/serine phosphatase
MAVASGCKKMPCPKERPEQNPQQFTTALKIELPGCGNLYKVSDMLYRGQQPTAEGFKELQKFGIKTVVNLRNFHSDKDELEGTNLICESIPMKTWDPEKEQVEAFLKIVTEPQKQPVFVHCQHGADRTGTMVAVYRIVVQGWNTQKAIDEMRYGPFGFHEVWTGLPKFIQELDVEKLRKEFTADSPAQTRPDGSVQ